MPALRGHHLVCLNFYHGEGYDEAFVRNLDQVMEKVRTEGVLILSGADDICRACFNLRDGLCAAAPDADSEIREMDRKALELLGFSPGITVRWETIEDRIPAFFRLWHDAFCRDCPWRKACEKDSLFLAMKAPGS